MAMFNKNLTHVLVLQGGGALGAYQAGAFSVLADESYRPDYVVGISIGAINSAIIAGNKPEQRVERLRTFWDRVTSGGPAWRSFANALSPFLRRSAINGAWAGHAAMTGAPGFFSPRVPPPFLQSPGSSKALSSS